MKVLRVFFLLIGLMIATVSQASFWSAIKGTAPESSITFAPVGFHVFDALRGISQPNDLNFMTALNYKSYMIGTFNNSERNQVYYIGINRNVYVHKKFSIGYLIGIMHGYHGYLKQSFGPIFGHDPGPLIAISMRYTLTQHFDLFSSFYGAGILFGGDYRF